LASRGSFTQTLSSVCLDCQYQPLKFTQFPIPCGVQFVNRPQIQIKTILSIPFGENAYIAQIAGRRDCLVVDPGLEPEKVIDHLQRRELTPAVILNTHGHSDHIAGNAALKQRWPDCPLVIGRGDAGKLTDPQRNLSASFGVTLVSPPADRTVAEGDQVEAAGFVLDVYDAPGHSAGHIVLVCRQTQPWRVLAGDVLFRDSIGRSDFFDGDFDALRRTIHEKLFTLPEDSIVLPGHGPETTIGHEKRHNPFVGAPAGYEA
jgi:hydroxyacylglutathione hydrolase